ncbi:MAG TPA: CARDB domain-containing protein, partial [Solirubrobacterales bacterium]|nr:CARDB domain-containing protein [Solirubrobacterales bacterium]
KVKGPKSVKKGKKGTYKVTVKNTGTAIAKGVKIAASGKGASGKASGGNIAPGASKTISVKVKFSKKGRFKVKLRASAKGVAANVGRIAIAVG